MTFFQIIIIILKSLIIIVPVLIAVAFFTLLERKIMAGIQRRRGPNVVGILGVLQPFADGLKLLIKETIIPSKANKVIFILAPILTLFLSFLNYTVIDKKNNRLIIFEGFTYAPSVSKRAFVFELEAIAKSMKIN